MQVQHRYNAACAASLAGSGQGHDDPPLDDAARARWRKQAIDWLKADLAAWSKVLENGPPQARQAISPTLHHWKTDSDLASLRDAAALAKLPEDEQKACHALWSEVERAAQEGPGPQAVNTADGEADEDESHSVGPVPPAGYARDSPRVMKMHADQSDLVQWSLAGNATAVVPWEATDDECRGGDTGPR